jgi:hypothetical protein
LEKGHGHQDFRDFADTFFLAKDFLAAGFFAVGF